MAKPTTVYFKLSHPLVVPLTITTPAVPPFPLSLKAPDEALSLLESLDACVVEYFKALKPLHENKTAPNASQDPVVSLKEACQSQGVDFADVQFLMKNCQCSFTQAVEALQKHDHNLVSAVLVSRTWR